MSKIASCFFHLIYSGTASRSAGSDDTVKNAKGMIDHRQGIHPLLMIVPKH